MKIVVIILLLFSAAASIYYATRSIMHPESALVYNKAGMSRAGIQLLSLLLGVGGALEFVFLQIPIVMLVLGYP